MGEVLPELGAVFWPVGTGDSSTVVVNESALIQVDLHDLAKADDDDTHEVPVVDLLVEALPRGTDGRPYLAVFVLTHADKDHCSGFEELLDQVTIGELWATPRLWREYADAGRAGAVQGRHRRSRKSRSAGSRRRRRPWPAARSRPAATASWWSATTPTTTSTPTPSCLTGSSPRRATASPRSTAWTSRGRFEAFIHAPFKDDCAEARNETSLSMQVTLTEDGGQDGKLLLFGDLAHDTIMKIFNYSEDQERERYLAWDLLLAPHHCSKKVMYVREDGKDVLKDDVLDAFRAARPRRRGRRVQQLPHPGSGRGREQPAAPQGGRPVPGDRRRGQLRVHDGMAQRGAPVAGRVRRRRVGRADPERQAWSSSRPGPRLRRPRRGRGAALRRWRQRRRLRAVAAGGPAGPPLSRTRGPAPSVSRPRPSRAGRRRRRRPPSVSAVTDGPGPRRAAAAGARRRQRRRDRGTGTRRTPRRARRFTISMDTSGLPPAPASGPRPGAVPGPGRDEVPVPAPGGLGAPRRWARTPHVQWGSHLCLYAAPSVEWVPSDGMDGFIERLSTWVVQAAAGTLDPDGQPLHPPVAYPSAGAGSWWYIPMSATEPRGLGTERSAGELGQPQVASRWRGAPSPVTASTSWSGSTGLTAYDRVLADGFSPFHGGRPLVVIPVAPDQRRTRV